MVNITKYCPFVEMNFRNDSKYYQFIPLVWGSLTILIMIITFSANIMNEKRYSISSSNTMIAITSQPFISSLFVSIGLLVPFAADHVFVLPNLFQLDIFVRLESYILPFLVVIMQGFNIYCITQMRTTNEGYFWGYYMGTYIQFIILYNAVLAIQANLAQKSWDMIVAIVASAAFANTGILVKLFALVRNDVGSPARKAAWLSCFAIATVCNVYIARAWLIKYRWTQKTGLRNQPDIYAFCKMCTLLLFLIAFNMLDVMTNTIEDAFLNDTESHVTMLQCLLMGFFFFISEISYRRTKDLAKFSLEALETKRAFVRYVSHEIRTPLNTATLGLQLLNNEISKIYASATSSPALSQSNMFIEHRITSERLSLDKKAQSALLELVNDTQQACNVAVEILNDLLMYEKIDGGLMALEVNEVLAWPFVSEVLKMFSVQAKALNLELLWKTNVKLDVFVTIDSYKMSQVLRNLVSNALKFTKAGGTVTVSAEIIPKTKKRTGFDRYFSVRSESNDNSSRRRSGKSQHPIVHNDSRRFSFDHLSHQLGLSATVPRMPSQGTVETNAQHAATEGDEESHSVCHHVMEEDEERSPPLTQSMRRASAPHRQSFFNQFFSSPVAQEDKEKEKYKEKEKENNPKVAVDILRILVTDTGAGISKDNQKRLFNEIVQFDAAKLQQGKGSGIGLWVSNKIMKLHGGSIGVYSEGEGQGSTFYIDIPITRTRQSTTQLYITNNSNSSSHSSLQSTTLPSEPTAFNLRNYLPHFLVGRKQQHQQQLPVAADESSLSTVGERLRRMTPALPALSSLRDSFLSLSGSVEQTVVLRTTTSPSSQYQHQHQQPQLHSVRKSSHRVTSKRVVPSHSHRQTVDDNTVTSLTQYPTNTTSNGHPNSSGVEEMANNRRPSDTVLHQQRLAKLNERQALRHQSQSQSQQTQQSAGERLPWRVLVVDDSVVNRKMLRKSLQPLVALCDEASNGRECLSLSPTDRYDVIITDYSMPEMNGLEMVKVLRGATVQYRGLIVGVTGHTEQGMMEGFRAVGVDAILTKPFQTDQLYALLAAYQPPIPIPTTITISPV